LPARSSVTINTTRARHTAARVDRAVTRNACRQHSRSRRNDVTPTCRATCGHEPPAVTAAGA
jgi:hypothetical protein